MLNRQIGRVAIDVGDGNYTVADLNGDELALGDVVIGNLDSHGGCTWRVEAQSRIISVFVKVVQATHESAQLQTLGP